MPSFINTNIISQRAQFNLNKSGNDLNTALERLSSGLRINSAKDDAAGLAIVSRMTAQVRGLSTAARNANDGISLAQTAEGAMAEINDVLQRMRELSVQSASDNNTASDRKALDNEMQQLFQEIDHIAKNITFNSREILNGFANCLQLQVGINAGETIDLSIGSVTTEDMTLNGFSALGELNSGRLQITASGGSDITINSVTITTDDGTTAFTAASAINAHTASTGVVAEAYNTVTGTSGVSGVTSGLTINGDTVTASSSMDNLVENINRDVAGVTAALDSSGSLVLNNDTGATMTKN